MATPIFAGISFTTVSQHVIWVGTIVVVRRCRVVLRRGAIRCVVVRLRCVCTWGRRALNYSLRVAMKVVTTALEVCRGVCIITLRAGKTLNVSACWLE